MAHGVRKRIASWLKKLADCISPLDRLTVHVSLNTSDFEAALEETRKKTLQDLAGKLRN